MLQCNVTLFPDLYLDFSIWLIYQSTFCSLNICALIWFLARFEEHRVAVTSPHGAAGLWHLDSSQGHILLLPIQPLAGAVSAIPSGCAAAGPPSQPHSEAREAPLGLAWAELIPPAAPAVAPPRSRSKGIRWLPEPQAPARGRMLLLKDGDL